MSHTESDLTTALTRVVHESPVHGPVLVASYRAAIADVVHLKEKYSDYHDVSKANGTLAAEVRVLRERLRGAEADVFVGAKIDTAEMTALIQKQNAEIAVLRAVADAAKSAHCDSRSGLMCDEDCANRVLSGPLDRLEAFDKPLATGGMIKGDVAAIIGEGGCCFPLKPENMKGAGDEFGGEDFPSGEK